MNVSFLANKGNQLAVACDSGYQLYEVANSSLRRLHNETSLGAVSLVAVEETSSVLVACLSNQGSHLANRVVALFDLAKKEVITELHFEEPVLALKVNMVRLVVIMEKRTHMFEWSTLKPLPQISTTSPPNTRGLGALSHMSYFGEPSYFAWPHIDTNSTRGDAVVMDVMTGKTMLIPAHQTAAITSLEFSPNGTRLATCSVKGTIIRVFSIPGGELLYNFRRGTKDAIIDSLVFSPTGGLLAVTSNSSTLHVFKCDSKATLSGTGASVNDDVRSFAKITVKESVRYAVGISEADDQLYLVARPPAGTAGSPSSDAVVEVYNIPRGGGEVRKANDFRLR